MRKASTAILIGAIALFAFPLLLLVALSFRSPDQSAVSGLLSQYERALTDEQYLIGLKNSAVITCVSLVFHLPVSMGIGLMLVKVRAKWIGGLKALLVLALLLPFQVMMLPVYKLSLLAGLYDTQWSVILLAAFSPMGPLMMFVLLKGIPDSLWEAASLETSSLCQTLRWIILPQILPGLAMLCILTFADIWNMVEQPLILLPTSALQPISLAFNDIVKGSEKLKDSCAGSVIYALPIVLLYAAFGRLLRKSSDL